jgi:GxxExxY protein
MKPNGSTGCPDVPIRLVDRELSHAIVGCAFEVHDEFGYGFAEAVYTRSLAVALQARGIRVEREYPVTVVFRGVEVGIHRLDLMVENRVVIEVKTLERFPEAAKAQVRRYLFAARRELGIVINFGPRVEYRRVLGPRVQAQR